MRARSLCSAFVPIALAIVCGVSAAAQSVLCAGLGMGGGIVYGIGGMTKNAPFSATIKQSFEQKLADGNAIHTVKHTHQARDSSGRTMTETEQGCFLGADGQMHERFIVNVNDPGAHVNMSWQVGGEEQLKVVRVFHHPDPAQIQRPKPSAEQLAERHKMMEAAAQQGQLRQQREFKTEDLGARNINGVSVRGSRITRTIPAGEDGNDQPLVIITETWRSRELGLVLMAVNDDPRRGKTTTEYEELTLGEPDPGLFAAPAGYTVQEQPQVGMLGGGVIQ